MCCRVVLFVKSYTTGIYTWIYSCFFFSFALPFVVVVRFVLCGLTSTAQHRSSLPWQAFIGVWCGTEEG